MGGDRELKAQVCIVLLAGQEIKCIDALKEQCIKDDF